VSHSILKIGDLMPSVYGFTDRQSEIAGKAIEDFKTALDLMAYRWEVREAIQTTVEGFASNPIDFDLKIMQTLHICCKAFPRALKVAPWLKPFIYKCDNLAGIYIDGRNRLDPEERLNFIGKVMKFFNSILIRLEANNAVSNIDKEDQADNAAFNYGGTTFKLYRQSNVSRLGKILVKKGEEQTAPPAPDNQDQDQQDETNDNTDGYLTYS
jgi:hypothetical protein